MTSETTIQILTLDDIRDVLQQAGYRVEQFADPSGVTLLRSATAGLPFDLRLGAPLAGGNGYGDITLIAGLQIEGELPLAIVNQWNSMRRFGRLHVAQNFLVLAMDVLIFGGVARAHLRGEIEIWDRLLQELVPYLRAELNRPAADGDGQAKALAASPVGSDATAHAA
jgi:Putative bacterial sensory transduction regulator